MTLADVARFAGVSMSTVSRVLNNSAKVRPATRQRVEEAIQRLGYSPHVLARSLATGQSMAVGVVIPNLSNPGLVDVIHAAEEVARGQGYRLLLTSTYEDAEREAASYRDLIQRRVDGILLWTRRPSPELQGLVATGPPVVCINTHLTGQRVGVVMNDSRGAAAEMARHLVSLGHRRIGLLAGPPHFEPSLHLRDGFAQGLAEAGLELPPHMIITAGARFEGGYEAARELLDRQPRPEAIFAFNNLVAAGALMACREMGLRVPEDVGLAASEDTLVARLLDPPLTTIDFPSSQIGMAAMHLLLAIVRGGQVETREVTILGSLTVRKSCGEGVAVSVAAP